MLELNWKQVGQPAFVSGFKKMMQGPNEGWLSYQLGKTSKVLETEEAAFKEAFKNILKGLDALKEDGSYQVPDEKKADFESQVEKLMAEKFQVPLKPVPLDVLKGEYSADEMLALEPILEVQE